MTPRTQIPILAGFVAMGALPLYVHLPIFLSRERGLALGLVSALLLAMRLIDMIQDPIIGRAIDRFAQKIRLIAILASILMTAGFYLLFIYQPSGALVAWLGLGGFMLFTGHSTLYILLYKSSSQSDFADAPKRREIGLLVGVLIGAALPSLIGALGLPAYQGFGFVMAILAVIIAVVMNSYWRPDMMASAPLDLTRLRQSGAGRLLLLVFLNNIPVAITSTLFLFFVTDRLRLPNGADALLMLFFIGAMMGVWLTARFGGAWPPRRLLGTAMLASAAIFACAFALPAGALAPFGVISILSGVALGVELYLLPIAFARLMAREHLQMGAGFGLWAFLSKLALSSATIIVLPLLAAIGFEAGGDNGSLPLMVLAISYALIPSLVKLVAFILMMRMPSLVWE